MNIEHITLAGTNIFEVVGLPDAESLKLRSQLMMEVRQYFEESGLTQVAAAKVLKTSQPRLNDVLKGRIDKCSSDRLVQMLAEAGRHVSITVSNAA